MSHLDQVNQCHRVSRLTLAFIFAYHGIVPKWIWFSATEAEMLAAHSLSEHAQLVAQVGGLLELGIALLLVIFYRAKWPVYLAIASLGLLLLDVAFMTPHLLAEAFNPVTTNLAGFALAFITLRLTNLTNQPEQVTP